MRLNLLTRTATYFALAFLHCIPAAIALAQSESLAGRVIATTGAVTAVTTNNSSPLNLTRSSNISVGTTVNTGANAQIQMRFIDGSMLALGCSSSLNIESYDYKENPPSDRVQLQLLNGRMRMISGSVAAMNRRAFSLTIGDIEVTIRGTDFELWIDEQDQSVYAAVFQGGITVSNEAGEIMLGVEGAHDFARVRAGLPPTALTGYPAPPC